MLIGGEFNSRAKQLLSDLAKLSKGDTGKRIPVQEVVEQMDLDRVELKNLFKYLDNKEYILAATIGGPFLYGHIYITEKGLQKAAQ